MLSTVLGPQRQLLQARSAAMALIDAARGMEREERHEASGRGRQEYADFLFAWRQLGQAAGLAPARVPLAEQVAEHRALHVFHDDVRGAAWVSVAVDAFLFTGVVNTNDGWVRHAGGVLSFLAELHFERRVCH